MAAIRTALLSILAAGALISGARAASPPGVLNYQGVLRNAAGAPVTGTYDVVFRLHDAPTGGNEVLVDSHTAALGSAVSVSAGLLGAAIGGGTVVDGSGPGTYATLAAAFRAFGTLHLSVQVGGEALAPRIPVRSAGYALSSEDSERLDGFDSASFGRIAAAETISGNWVNTANPWADNEVADSLTVAGAVTSAATVTLQQGTAPADATEGRVQWDTDDDRLVVGDGAGTKVFHSGPHTTTLAWSAITSQPNVVSSVDGVVADEGNINLVAGANVTITPNDVSNSITIDAASVDAEQLDGYDSADFLRRNVAQTSTGASSTLFTIRNTSRDGFGVVAVLGEVSDDPANPPPFGNFTGLLGTASKSFATTGGLYNRGVRGIADGANVGAGTLYNYGVHGEALGVQSGTGPVENFGVFGSCTGSGCWGIGSDDGARVIGQVQIIGQPAGTGVGGGNLYVNPLSSPADGTLIGAAVNGVEKLRVDRDGDTEIQGSLGVRDGFAASNTALYARLNSASASGGTYGVHGWGEDSGAAGVVYGVAGSAYATGGGNTKVTYGIYGAASGGATNWGFYTPNAASFGDTTIAGEDLDGAAGGYLNLRADRSLDFVVDDDANDSNELFQWWKDGVFSAATKVADLDQSGNLRLRGTISQNFAFDVAESFFAGEPVAPGELVRVDAERSNGVLRTTGADDVGVLGVVSARPGVLLGSAPFDVGSLRESWGDDVLARYVAEAAALRAEVLARTPSLRTDLGPPVETGGTAGTPPPPPVDAGDRAAKRESAIESESLRLFFERRFVAVALAGRVPVEVEGSGGAIRAGDPIGPSPTAGVARKAIPGSPVIGTALEAFDGGRGRILAFVHRGVATGSAQPAVTTDRGSVEVELGAAGERLARLSVVTAGEASLAGELLRVDADGNVWTKGTLRPASLDLAEYHPVSEPVDAGDVLVADRERVGAFRRSSSRGDPAVVGVVSSRPGVLLGGSLERIAAADPELAARLEDARTRKDPEDEARLFRELEKEFRRTHAPLALSGTVPCRVETSGGPIEIGSLLVAGGLPGHAMRSDDPRPGTVIGKALEPLPAGTGTIRILVMTR